jgi:membrane fusion protein (multidrug efflux system)
MAKRIIITIIGLTVLVGVIGGIKGLQIERMVTQGSQFVPPPGIVTTASVRNETWESVLTSVGSLVAVQGVIITAELSGKVVRVAFEPGSRVKAGDLLLKQDTTSEQAQLRAAEATVTLARINLKRLGKLLAGKTIAKSQHDDAEAQYKQASAQADAIRATIAKKTIRAPFAGRLGVRLVNLGQIINEGEAIVSLQSLDPIYVNFFLPQQQIAQIRTGLTVRVTTDALAGMEIEGEITAINPQIDVATRNVQVQATVSNRRESLRPGMYVNVSVVLPVEEEVLAIPATAVLYATYGDSVFVVEDSQNGQNPRPTKVLRQQFVRLGKKRGDFVSVVSGLKDGETVVSTGVFKLRNGQAVVVDNKLAPEFKLTPRPEDN